MSTLSAPPTLANYQTALRSITYTNSSDTPSTANRTISFVVTDGSSSAAAATKTVSVTAVNDTPIVTTSAGTTAFTEGNNVASTPVVIDGALSVSDVDSANLTGATV